MHSLARRCCVLDVVDSTNVVKVDVVTNRRQERRAKQPCVRFGQIHRPRDITNSYSSA